MDEWKKVEDFPPEPNEWVIIEFFDKEYKAKFVTYSDDRCGFFDDMKTNIWQHNEVERWRSNK